MTLEELSILISVNANDALAVLDELEERLQALGEKKGQKNIEKALDTEPVKVFGSAAKAMLENMGSATKSAAGDVAKELAKGENAAWGLADAFQGIWSAGKSIFSKGLIGAGIDLLLKTPDIIQGIVEAQERAREEERRREEQRRQGVYDEADDNQKRLDNLKKLQKRYEELGKKDTHTVDEAEDLNAIQQKLVEGYGAETQAVAYTKEAYAGLNEEMKKCIATQAEILYSSQNDATWERIDAAKEASKEYFEIVRQINEMSEKFTVDELNATHNERTAAWDNLITKVKDGPILDLFEKEIMELLGEKASFKLSEVIKRILDAEKQKIPEINEKFLEWIASHFAQTMTDRARKGFEVPDELAQAVLSVIQESFNIADYLSFEEADAAIRDALKKIAYCLTDPEIAEAAETLRTTLGQAQAGIFDEECMGAFEDAWNTIFGEDSELLSSAGQFFDQTKEGWREATGAILATALGLDGLNGTEAEAEERLWNTAEAAAEASGAFSDITNTCGEYRQELAGIDKELSRNNAIRDNVKKWQTLRKSYEDAKKEGKDTAKIFASMADVLQALDPELKMAADNMTDVDRKVADMGSAADTANQEMSVRLNEMLNNMRRFKEELESRSIMGDVDVSGPLAAIEMVITTIRALLGMMGEANIEPTGGRSGGGGGSSSSTPSSSKSSGPTKYEKLIDELEHLKAMEQKTLEQELAYLEDINANAKKYKLTTQERLDLEERIFDVRKQIARQEADNLDTATDGIITALETRYEKMMEVENERLDTSREAWKKWRDDGVSAIEEQIAALDKLADAEDREAKDAEELRKIEKLRRQIEYEQDDYNRLKLQQQLEQAMASREERLRKLALADQKDALQEEIEQINEKADSEIAALDEEQKRIEEAYAERLKAAALEAEAEKLLMQSTQEEIIELLKEFAPDYNLTGRTLGEKLLEGFREKAGSIVEWFEGLTEQMEAFQEQATALAQEAADSFYQGQRARSEANAANATTSVVVEQRNVFNTPVESPSETARRVRKANEALAEELLNG